MHAVDFLANNGQALDESNRADESVQRRLDYALKYVSLLTQLAFGSANICRAFSECEQKIINVVRPMLAAA